jgi:tRNA (cytidine/uridine-2'-O-)-methyltransferase
MSCANDVTGVSEPNDAAASAGLAQDAPLNIVLVEPEIPQNTGNVARTCACTGARLHLVEPMGFALTQRNLARAGCDYWDEVDIVRWACAEEFFEAHANDELHLFTGHVSRSYADVRYNEGCYLVFGRESRGLDERWMGRFADACVRIPMRDGMRSLNLSNSAAIAAFEACRQMDWPNLR